MLDVFKFSFCRGRIHLVVIRILYFIIAEDMYLVGLSVIAKIKYWVRVMTV